jgi:tetratricopeptide (TPR) repeat protein
MFLRALLLVVILATASTSQTDQRVPLVSSSPVEALLSEGKAAFQAGKFQLAVDTFSKVLAEEPNSAEAYAGLIRVFIKQNDLSKADETAKKGIAATDDSKFLHTAVAELYFRQGKIGDSELLYVKVLNSGSRDARAYLGLARIRRATSMFKQEKEFIDRAYQLDPLDPDVQKYWMGTLKRPARIKFLEEYLSRESNDDRYEREHLRAYLEILKDRDQNSRRNCRLVSKVEATETKLNPIMIDPQRVQGLSLTVSFNERKAQLLLDTGASGLIVKKSIAQKAGIVPIVRSTQAGIGNAKDMGVSLGYADSIRIGELEFQDCLVMVSDKTVGSSDGLIGSDVFSHYLVDIDFQHQRLRLSPLPKRPNEITKATSLSPEGSDSDELMTASSDPESDKKIPDPGPQDRYIAPEMQKYVKVLRFGHVLLISTRVGDTPPGWFIIDSGAAMNGISPAAAREVTKVRANYDLRLKGMSGEVDKVFVADKAMLQFAGFRQENQNLTSWDLSAISKNIGTEVSGLLGFTTLHLFDLKIDYRDGLVQFGFNEKAFK